MVGTRLREASPGALRRTPRRRRAGRAARRGARPSASAPSSGRVPCGALHEHADLLAVDATETVTWLSSVTLSSRGGSASGVVAEVHRVTAGDEHDAIADSTRAPPRSPPGARSRGRGPRPPRAGGGEPSVPRRRRGDRDSIPLEDGFGVSTSSTATLTWVRRRPPGSADRDARGPGGGGHLVRGADAERPSPTRTMRSWRGRPRGAADRVADGGGRAARIEARAVRQRRTSSAKRRSGT